MVIGIGLLSSATNNTTISVCTYEKAGWNCFNILEVWITGVGGYVLAQSHFDVLIKSRYQKRRQQIFYPWRLLESLRERIFLWMNKLSNSYRATTTPSTLLPSIHHPSERKVELPEMKKKGEEVEEEEKARKFFSPFNSPSPFFLLLSKLYSHSFWFSCFFFSLLPFLVWKRKKPTRRRTGRESSNIVYGHKWLSPLTSLLLLLLLGYLYTEFKRGDLDYASHQTLNCLNNVSSLLPSFHPFTQSQGIRRTYL